MKKSEFTFYPKNSIAGAVAAFLRLDIFVNWPILKPQHCLIPDGAYTGSGFCIMKLDLISHLVAGVGDLPDIRPFLFPGEKITCVREDKGLINPELLGRPL